MDMEHPEQIKEAREELYRELKKLEKRRDHLCNLADLWVREGMLQSGFYHGDLHAGNIMIDDEKATIIDFGNSTKMTEEQQKWVMGMLFAAISKDTNLYFEGFVKLLDKKDDPKFKNFFNDEKKNQIKEEFRKIMKLGKEEDAGQRIIATLLKAQELGVEVPAAVWGFAQGQTRLMNTIDEANEKIKDLLENIRQLTVLTVRNKGTAAVNPISAIQQEMRDSSTRVDPLNLEKNFDAMLERYSIIGEEEKAGVVNELFDTSKKTVPGKAEKVDMMREFERKYLSRVRFARGFFTKDGRNEQIKYKWEGKYDNSELEKRGDHGFEPYLEPEQKVNITEVSQKLRDYIEKYKGKTENETKAQRDARLKDAPDIIKFYPDEDSDLAEEIFGRPVIVGLGAAIFDFDVKVLENALNIFEVQLPLMFEVADKYDAFRSAQEAGKRQSELTQLSDDLMSSYLKLEKSRLLNLEAVVGMKQRLHPKQITDNEQSARSVQKSVALGLEPMFKDEVYGERLKAAYDDFKKYDDLKEAGRPLTEEENASLAGKSLDAVLNEKEKTFLSLWQETSVRMLKNYKEQMCSTKMKLDKEKDFITVMGKICSENWIRYKAMMKVGFSLGWKIIRSSAN